jgi:hypothetical protein
MISAVRFGRVRFVVARRRTQKTCARTHVGMSGMPKKPGCAPSLPQQ